ncbi:MAG: hypothetical protein KDK23_03815 [Leptospiraceae bacterium]|nr:hypothetical protein [Leptospiraceae bacterium]
MFLLFALLALAGCSRPWNHPYPETAGKDWYLIAMASEPSTMDPVRMNDAPSFAVASNLVVTPFQYSYLKRPIQMEPFLARSIPEVMNGELEGRSVYFFDLHLSRKYYAPVEECLKDEFEDDRGRPILARDLELNLKRNADPGSEAFMYSLLAENIVGFEEYNQYMREKREKSNFGILSAEEQAAVLAESYAKPISGVKVLGPDRLRIYIKSSSDRILYFFAMVSSAPIPWNCWNHYVSQDRNEHGLDRNLIASGPFYLTSWEPRDKIILDRNELYDEKYPQLGDESSWPEALKKDNQRAANVRELSGTPLPMSDRVILYLIQSGSTVWTLFEQGYQDRVTLTSDSYEGVLEGGELRQEYIERGVRLTTEAELATFGWIFNLEDPVLKNNLPLRQAIRCSINTEELIRRFFEGRAIIAHGLIPPGMEGFRNSPMHARDCSPARMQELMKAAGYPDGLDPKTNKPLTLRIIDVPRPASASFHSFLVEQVGRLGIRLQVDLYDAPTYFEKRMKGEFQITTWAWGADYPDPQNFFQLFYGPNSETTYNEAHFIDPDFDAAYRALERTSDPARRQELIATMNGILEDRVPVLLFFHRISYGISQPWTTPYEPHPMGTNLLQYIGVDAAARDQFQLKYNSLW